MEEIIEVTHEDWERGTGRAPTHARKEWFNYHGRMVVVVLLMRVMVLAAMECWVGVLLMRVLAAVACWDGVLLLMMGDCL